MQISRKYVSPLTRVIAFMIFCMTATVPVAQASMVPTDRLMIEQQKQWNKEQLSMLIEREEVKTQLQSMGVDINDVQARIDALTDVEIQQMSSNIQ